MNSPDPPASMLWRHCRRLWQYRVSTGHLSLDPRSLRELDSHTSRAGAETRMIVKRCLPWQACQCISGNRLTDITDCWSWRVIFRIHKNYSLSTRVLSNWTRSEKSTKIRREFCILFRKFAFILEKVKFSSEIKQVIPNPVIYPHQIWIRNLFIIRIRLFILYKECIDLKSLFLLYLVVNESCCLSKHLHLKLKTFKTHLISIVGIYIVVM